MEELIERLRDLLERGFENAEVVLEEASPNKVGGFLIWSGFDGMDQLERQQKLWKVLRADLPRAEQLRITAILTLTPTERSVPSES